MKLTRFADRFSKKTGILELMDDLGQVMDGQSDMRMLGGGNPAHIPEVNKIWRRRTEEILSNGYKLEETLANGSLGQVLVRPLIDSGDILRISRDVIHPFYKARSKSAIAAIEEAFSPGAHGGGIAYRIHESEGSIFLWLWLPDLPIKSAELYERLKARMVLVISAHYFFYGLDHHWAHSDECLRLSYAFDPVKFKEAAVIMADEIRRVMDEAQ